MPSPPRIAFLLADLRLGGAERVMLTLVRHCLALGFAVDVVLLRGTGELLQQVPAEARVVSLSRADGVGKLHLVLSSFWPLVRYLRRERPLALLSTITGTNVVAVLARRLSAVGTRLVLREAAPLVNNGALVRRLLMRVAYRDADAVVAVAQGVVNDLAGIGIARERLHVIRNPVDTEALRSLASAPLELRGFAPDGLPLVLAVGRLAVQKDYPTLLRAFALVRKRQDARLLIIGEGPCRPALEALVRSLSLSDAVSMPGHADNPYPAFAKAAVFVLSSTSEGYPNALLEALALEVPAVATDCPYGPSEMLDHGRRGTLVPVGDVPALAAAIEQVLRDGRPGAGLAAESLPGPREVTRQYLDVLLGRDRASGASR